MRGALIAVLLAGCSSASRSPAPSEIRSRESSGGAYLVTYQPRPDPIPLNQLFSVEIGFLRRDGKPDSGARVVVDAAMPAHHHGMTLQPRVQRLSEGRFRVDGLLFHMPGSWELYVDVTEGRQTERARFDIELK